MEVLRNEASKRFAFNDSDLNALSSQQLSFLYTAASFPSLFMKEKRLDYDGRGGLILLLEDGSRINVAKSREAGAASCFELVDSSGVSSATSLEAFLAKSAAKVFGPKSARSAAAFVRERFAEIKSALVDPRPDPHLLADLLDDPIVPIFFNDFKLLMEEGFVDSEVEEALEAFRIIRNHGILVNALPRGVETIMNDTITFDWQCVVLLLNFRDEKYGGATSYSVQRFPLDGSPKSVMTHFASIELALDNISSVLVEVSDTFLSHPPKSTETLLIDYNWLRVRVENQGFYSFILAPLCQIVMENMSYVDPKAVHIFCGSDLPVSRLESFGDLHKFASPKAASEALVEFARGQKGPCLILAEGDKLPGHHQAIPWGNPDDDADPDALSNWAHHFSFGTNQGSRPLIAKAVHTTQRAHNPFDIFTESLSAPYDCSLLIRLPLWPHYSIYHLCQMVLELGFQLRQFRLAVKEAKPSHYLSSNTPYAIISFHDEATLRKFVAALGSSEDIASRAFVARSWPRWAMEDYAAIRKYLFVDDCAFCSLPLDPEEKVITCPRFDDRHSIVIHAKCLKSLSTCPNCGSDVLSRKA